VDTGVGYKIDLEFVDIDVERTLETKGSGKRADHLSDQSVQVGVGGLLETKVVTADVVDGLVVEHEGNIGVFEEGVGREDGVVGLNDAGRDLGRRKYAKVQLALLSVINGESLEEKSTETRTSTTAYRVEDEEALKAVAVFGKFPDFIQDGIDMFLAYSVVAAGVVVGSILLAGDELIRMEELGIFANFDVIYDGGLQIEVDATRHVFAASCLAEEGVEGKGLVGVLSGFREGSVGVDTVLEAVEFPAGGTDLNTSLANMERDNFTHFLDR